MVIFTFLKSSWNSAFSWNGKSIKKLPHWKMQWFGSFLHHYLFFIKSFTCETRILCHLLYFLSLNIKDYCPWAFSIKWYTSKSIFTIFHIQQYYTDQSCHSFFYKECVHSCKILIPQSKLYSNKNKARLTSVLCP